MITAWPKVYKKWEENYSLIMDNIFGKNRASHNDIIAFENKLTEISTTIKLSSSEIISLNNSLKLWYNAKSIIKEIPKKIDSSKDSVALQHIENLVLFVGMRDGIFYKADKILRNYADISIPEIKRVIMIFEIEDHPPQAPKAKKVIDNFRNAIAHQKYEIKNTQIRYNGYKGNDVNLYAIRDIAGINILRECMWRYSFSILNNFKINWVD